MDAAEYQHNLRNLETALRQASMFLDTVTDEELTSMARTASMADSVGFIVDPTKYRDAMNSGTLDYQKGLIEMGQDLKRRLKVLRDLAAKGTAYVEADPFGTGYGKSR